MNNFELHEIAQELADTHTPYQLAKLLVKTMEHLDNFDRYNNTIMCSLPIYCERWCRLDEQR
ncbi:hypothetical protein VPHK406_0147 [Vibrio phage K406]